MPQAGPGLEPSTLLMGTVQSLTEAGSNTYISKRMDGHVLKHHL